jgi:hypothetical protein
MTGKPFLVVVNFTGSTKPYVFKTFISDLVPEDRVVCVTSHGLVTALVKEYVKDTNVPNLKWVIAKVDPNSYGAHLEDW